MWLPHKWSRLFFRLTVMSSMSKIKLVLLPLLIFACSAMAGIREDIEQFIAVQKADIGLAVVLPDGSRLGHNNGKRYQLASVMKLIQAMALADIMEREDIPLTALVSITNADLQEDTYSPLRDKGIGNRCEMPIASLLDYSLQFSDNNACDILFRLIGGTEAVEAYLNREHIDSCQIHLTEKEMHLNPEQSESNWITPDAAVEITGLLLKESSRRPLFAHIVRTITQCETGLSRLPAPIERSTDAIGHKTGTGFIDSLGRITATNDIGFVQLQDGRTYTIAVFVKNSTLPPAETEAIIAKISEIVYKYIRKQ